MKCPNCNADSRVLSTRGEMRRRECFNGHRFSTIEIVHDSDADKRERRRVHIEAMEKARETLAREQEAIRKAEGTLQSIADRFNRSLSYVWTIKRRDHR